MRGTCAHGKGCAILKSNMLVSNGMEKKTDIALFAAGCFWGVEEAFAKIPSVLETAVGYSGGHIKRPTYEDVCGGATGHAEVVQAVYDPSVVSYDDLLKKFWSIHDYTQVNRQGPDVGTQYRSVIFYHSLDQKSAAEKSKPAGAVTEISPAPIFWPAEDYHQQYFAKQGSGVCHT